MAVTIFPGAGVCWLLSHWFGSVTSDGSVGAAPVRPGHTSALLGVAFVPSQAQGLPVTVLRLFGLAGAPARRSLQGLGLLSFKVSLPHEGCIQICG